MRYLKQNVYGLFLLQLSCAEWELFLLWKHEWGLVTLPFFFAQVNKLRSFEENGGRKTFYIIIVTKDTRVAKGSISFYIRTIMGASFKFKMGSGPIWMDDVQCKGHETSLTQCSFNGYGIHNCDHRDDLGFYCTVNFV